MAVTLRVLDITDAEQRAHREDRARMIGRQVTWQTWSGPTVATITYLGADGRCHLRSSDGHVSFFERLPEGAELVADHEVDLEEVAGDRIDTAAFAWFCSCGARGQWWHADGDDDLDQIRTAVQAEGNQHQDDATLVPA